MISDFHGSQSSCCGDSSFPGGERSFFINRYNKLWQVYIRCRFVSNRPVISLRLLLTPLAAGSDCSPAHYVVETPSQTAPKASSAHRLCKNVCICAERLGQSTQSCVSSNKEACPRDTTSDRKTSLFGEIKQKNTPLYPWPVLIELQQSAAWRFSVLSSVVSRSANDIYFCVCLFFCLTPFFLLMWNHGNPDKYLHICTAGSCQCLCGGKNNIWINTAAFWRPGLSVCRVSGLKATYLHDVIDQRVAEHPVQVDALVLQNVLEKARADRKNNCWNVSNSCSNFSRARKFISGWHTEPTLFFLSRRSSRTRTLPPPTPRRRLMINSQSSPQLTPFLESGSGFDVQLHHVSLNSPSFNGGAFLDRPEWWNPEFF